MFSRFTCQKGRFDALGEDWVGRGYHRVEIDASGVSLQEVRCDRSTAPEAIDDPRQDAQPDEDLGSLFAIEPEKEREREDHWSR